MSSNLPRMSYHRGYVSHYPMQFMPPPLYEIGSMWTPKLNHVDVYNSSGVDYCQAGWRKWNSAGHWDMHAMSATAVEPDWYHRKRQFTRDADLQVLDWHYDQYSKPTQFQTRGRQFPRNSQHVNREINNVTRKPGAIKGDIEPVRYGLYHAASYEQPVRTDSLPPLHDPKHK